MLDALSTDPGLVVTPESPPPGCPGDFAACAHPTLTSSCPVIFWVSASHEPLRWRSLKSGLGFLRVILSTITLNMVWGGSMYWTPTFTAASSPTPTFTASSLLRLDFLCISYAAIAYRGPAS